MDGWIITSRAPPERSRSWFFARYTKGYYGKIFLDRGPRQERSTLDAAQAAKTVRCAGEASAGPRARRPSCDGVK